MINFLRHVLPSEGWKCATIVHGPGKASNYFFATIEELAHFISDADAKGHAVYHACATFKNRGSRKQDNVLWVKSFYFDIDGGEDANHKGTGYARGVDAINAVAAFCKQLQLSAPTLVGSGTGFHVYYPLAETIAPGVWKQCAANLKRRAQQFGLRFDPARTADAASILRTPGTTNRKRAPVAVQCFHLAKPVAFSELSKKICSDESHQQDANFLTHRARAVTQLSLANISDGPPRYCDRIADQCKQLARFRSPEGQLPEPFWYACIGVTAFADDGDDITHAWSTKDPRYRFEETARKIAQARTNQTGATTCARLEELNPAGCQGCPFRGKIISPISLGYEQGISANGNGKEDTDTSGILESLPALPQNFTWQNRALVFQSGKLNGTADTTISTYPIYLLGIDESEVRKEFNLTFRQWLPAKGAFNIEVPADVLFSPQGIGALTKYGANIEEPDLFKKYVKAAINLHHSTTMILGMRYDQYGWKPEGFLYGATLYTANGEEPASGSIELKIRNENLGPGCAKRDDPSTGLERWKAAANTLFTAGCEFQSVALLCSFAAPLMHFVSGSEGGAILSLVNRQSGKGKTLALVAAASVWGTMEGLGLTNRDTETAKFLTLGALGNLPLIYDELYMKDPTFVANFVTDFTNGRERTRATRDGQIRHAAQRWQTIMVCASNLSLVELLSAGSDPDAPSYRLFELPADLPEGIAHKFGDKLKNELTVNAGYAGEVYARCLANPKIYGQLKHWVEQQTQIIWERTELPAKYRFWIRLIAVVSIAAMLVRHLELLDVSADRITEWLLDIVRDRVPMMISAETGKPVVIESADDWALMILARFIGAIHGETIVVRGHYTAERQRWVQVMQVPRERIRARFEVSTQKLIVSADLFREWCAANKVTWQELRKELIKGRILSETKKSTLTAGTDYAGTQIYVHEIDLTHPALNELRQHAQNSENNVVPLGRPQQR